MLHNNSGAVSGFEGTDLDLALRYFMENTHLDIITADEVMACRSRARYAD